MKKPQKKMLKNKKGAQSKNTKKPKELLDLNSPEADLTIVANFALEEIALKRSKGLRWRMKLEIFKILPKTYHTYSVEMDVDEGEFDNRIQAVEDKIEKIRTEKSLFADRDDKEIRNMRELIVGIEKERDERIKECDVISFAAEIEEIKYKDAHTHVLIMVPDQIIEQMNKQKARMSWYKINLKPLL